MTILPFARRTVPAAATLLVAGVAASQTAEVPEKVQRNQEPKVTEIRVPGKASVARVWSQREADGVPEDTIRYSDPGFTEEVLSNKMREVDERFI